MLDHIIFLYLSYYEIVNYYLMFVNQYDMLLKIFFLFVSIFAFLHQTLLMVFERYCLCNSRMDIGIVLLLNNLKSSSIPGKRRITRTVADLNFRLWITSWLFGASYSKDAKETFFILVKWPITWTVAKM